MKRYFKNLVIAFLGRNPYRVELESVMRSYNLTAERVHDMERAYERIEDVCEQLDKKIVHMTDGFNRTLSDYQNLTENLRSHLSEKDAEIAMMKEDCRKLLEGRDAAIESLKGELREKQTETARQLAAEVERHEKELREREDKIQALQEDLNVTLEQLQRVNKDIGREMMNTNLLAKTNNGLSDLCQAMISGEAEKMRQAVEYLDWSSYLTRIAHQHLLVLTRKDELEARMELENRD